MHISKSVCILYIVSMCKDVRVVGFSVHMRVIINKGKMNTQSIKNKENELLQVRYLEIGSQMKLGIDGMKRVGLITESVEYPAKMNLLRIENDNIVEELHSRGITKISPSIVF